MQKLICLTKGPKHHFFGFHDLKAWNKNDNKILSLEVDVINRPPLPGELAGVGYVNEEFNFIKLGTTNAYNFPQGSRMQWIGDSDNFVCNNQVGNEWGAQIYDAESNILLDNLPKSIHCLSKNCSTAFTINYSRLFRLGVYGYIGIEDKFKNEIIPDSDGIYIQDIQSKESKLLVSIAEVARFNSTLFPHKGFHHYLTHLSLNPECSRLAFLHRYRLEDGGEMTRLMTISTSGNDLRCLAFGFLSHFDWKNDYELIIYGRCGNAVDSMRNSKLFSNKYIGKCVRFSKKSIRHLFGNFLNGMNTSFWQVNDSLDTNIMPFALNKLTTDGHPMFNPINRDSLIIDTYPNESGQRDLILYKWRENIRIDLGKFSMINDTPDTKLWKEYTNGVDPKILKMFTIPSYSYTRSGLHCDLHPRWDAVGKKVSFDSIHEGTRQLYAFLLNG